MIYLLLVNFIISVLIGVWIFFDARARCMKSYYYHPFVIIIIGIIGLWIPYLIYYLIFRPSGKLIRCPRKKHFMLEYLDACPSCDPRLLWPEKKIETRKELWQAFDEVKTLLGKLKPASKEIIDREVHSWFDRLSHYQDTYTRYLTHSVTLLGLMAILGVVLTFYPSPFSATSTLSLFLLIVLFGYLGIGCYQLLRLVQSEIVRIKVVLSTVIGERVESLRMAEKSGFISYSAWTIQVAAASLVAINIFLVFSHLPNFNQMIIDFSTGPFSRLFLKVLFISLVFAIYMLFLMRVKNNMDLLQLEELYDLLKRLSGKEKVGVESKPASIKAKASSESKVKAKPRSSSRKK